MNHTIPKPLFQSAARAALWRGALALCSACAVATAQADAAAEAGAAYVDRLIDPVAAQREDVDAAAAERDLSPGLRSWSVEYRLDARDGSSNGPYRGQSLGIRHRRETREWGDFAFDIGIERNAVDALYPAGRARPRATFYHEQFALTDVITMTSALGVVRLLPPPGAGISFNPSSNVFLPSALLVGASTSLAWPDAELRAAGGRFARLSGTGQVVETTRGQLESVAYTRHFDGGGVAGIALTAVSGSQIVASHAALMLSLARPLPADSGDVRLLGMFDNGGRKGAALDAQLRSGLVAQRAGAWWLDRGLGFSEESAQFEGRGLYWRGDYRFGALTLGGGADFVQSSLVGEAERGSATDHSGWANVALRLDRSTSIGGAVALRSDAQRLAPAAPTREVLVNTFAMHTFPAGTSRWDVSQRSARGEGPAREIERTFGWNHDWPVFAGFTANTLAGVTNEIRPGQRTRRSAFSIGLRGPVSDTVSLNGSVTTAQSRAPGMSERNYNAAVGVSWNAERNWLVQLDWLRNAILPGADNPLAPFVRENAMLVSVRYEESGGTRYAGPHNGTTRAGTGAISGSVFFDENSDGVRQTTERPARGVLVVLDNRLTQVTDSDGRFAFALVTAGTHTLTIVSDRIPLPWASADDAPRIVRVNVRDELHIDFPLARLSP